jgi:hypothetical protein
MYLSRLTFATLPGHTREVEEKLRQLRELVSKAGGRHVRVLRSHFASLGAPDLVFEQEVPESFHAGRRDWHGHWQRRLPRALPRNLQAASSGTKARGLPNSVTKTHTLVPNLPPTWLPRLGLFHACILWEVRYRGERH